MDQQILSDLAGDLELRLPNALERITASLKDETFRETCLDYEECVKCLRYWTETATDRPERGEEYRRTSVALQEEILGYLRGQQN